MPSLPEGYPSPTNPMSRRQLLISMLTFSVSGVIALLLSILAFIMGSKEGGGCFLSVVVLCVGGVVISGLEILRRNR
jgi:hypothetical protein